MFVAACDVIQVPVIFALLHTALYLQKVSAKILWHFLSSCWEYFEAKFCMFISYW